MEKTGGVVSQGVYNSVKGGLSVNLKGRRQRSYNFGIIRLAVFERGV